MELRLKFGASYCPHSCVLALVVCASILARMSSMCVGTAMKKWARTSQEYADNFLFIRSFSSFLVDLF
jgi:hypothetical protein